MVLQYRQLVKHVFNAFAILIQDTLQATSPFADALINDVRITPSAVCRGSEWRTH